MRVARHRGCLGYILKTIYYEMHPNASRGNLGLGAL